MSKNNKILLGILTFLPVLGLFLSIAFMISAFKTIAIEGAPDAVMLSGSLQSAVMIIAFFAILSLGLLIYYIIHAINNKALSSDERVVWILLFVFISQIAVIIYWIMKIWNVKEDTISKDSNFQNDII